VVVITREEIVDEVKKEWKILWTERIDDKVRAEGIANRDYGLLFVEKGMVVFATRNFRMSNLQEILELHKMIDLDGIIPPNPHVGGWGKFIRTAIANQKPQKRIKRAQQYLDNRKQRQQLRKGGRGWLHF